MATTLSAAGSLLRPERRLLVLSVLGAAAAAWLVLLLAGEALPHHVTAASHDHHHDVGPSTTAVATGWLLMVVAMMLPPALPMFDLLRTLAARHRRPMVVVGAGVAAFVGVWAAAGVVLVGAGLGLRALAASTPWTAARPHLFAAAVLAVAGVYQLGPLAQACLRACRTPRGFAVAHWRGVRAPWVEAAAVAGAYGASCVGCCWALMTVSLVVGVAALPVMVVLTVLMAAQRLARHGRRLVRPSGFALLALGAVAATGLLPLT
ncbi:MAG: DUF2182 domain-containing protein [Pseudonocardia sp.]|nr:DUF2182 domain-containing protein [Pseudonocardia sp.]